MRAKVEFEVEKSEKLKKMGNINVQLHKNTCEIFMETNEDSLHKHGYRSRNVRGIIRETLAAASIVESGILNRAKKDGRLWLWDPFCGSGTFLIEAL